MSLKLDGYKEKNTETATYHRALLASNNTNSIIYIFAVKKLLKIIPIMIGNTNVYVDT